MSPRSSNPHITKTFNCPINRLRSRESTLTVHSNHSQFTNDIPQRASPVKDLTSVSISEGHLSRT
ncbi:hypothetical protein M5K25_024203 [Dendrobium thyrsiflorum]|uniref:Uncharacterized protein n=1 Tax=Dendrobium thyrsiflorum TaxID=117978 RepID=A0ABD0U1T6_DENTH